MVFLDIDGKLPLTSFILGDEKAIELHVLPAPEYIPVRERKAIQNVTNSIYTKEQLSMYAHELGIGRTVPDAMYWLVNYLNGTILPPEELVKAREVTTDALIGCLKFV